MSASVVVEVDGHIIDSLILPKILDVIVDAGVDYRLVGEFLRAGGGVRCLTLALDVGPNET